MQLKSVAIIVGMMSLSGSMAFAEGDKNKETKAADAKAGESKEVKEEKIPPKPALRNWTVKSEGHAFTFEFKPGIPSAGNVAEIMVNVAKIPKRPHPRFGNRIPVKGARLIIEVVNPAGESVGRYLAHPVKFSAGQYAFHVTPTQDGLYEMIAKLNKKGMDELEARLKMPVDVWPLPASLEGAGDNEGARASRRPVVRKRK